ncbi:alpha/beta fold hydrolase [Sediminibacillus massiliensis]|uniref:alpha/beta fold hydrolase n=1 Tax=Sediminibacillus massiliensis TaxID=1926277 RepID=UPI0009885690|nr:alpha/beta hydrolase [Sediminibacillus massiliensis]
MKNIEHANGIISYESEGQGIPVLFIHPPGMGSKVFEYQKAMKKDFRVIMPDFSGHGNSTNDIGESLIESYLEEIDMILKNEQLESAVLCGYSAGGMIAQSYTLKYPQKVEALILSGGYPRVYTKSLDYQYMLGMKLLKSSPDTLAFLIALSHAKTKSYRESLVDHMKKSDLSVWLQFYEETYLFDCVESLSAIKCPMLLMYGAKDFYSLPHKDFYERCGNLRMAIVSNSFHQLPTRKWESFNHIITDFINKEISAN